jgi:hypothetical protein
MPTYRAQVVFPMHTMLPGDVITNTFHFDPLTPLGFEATADLVTPELAQFYTAVYASGPGIANYMAISNDAFHVNWYDIESPPPHVPYTLPLGATLARAATTIPTEVACVLSIHAPVVGGVPMARRRGRLYIGGLTNAWVQASTSNQFPRFLQAAVNTVCIAAENLRDGVLAEGVRWSIWSQVDQASSLVEAGWVDDSPDTQRRRGVEPTARTIWPIP